MDHPHATAMYPGQQHAANGAFGNHNHIMQPKIRVSLLCSLFTHLTLFTTVFLMFMYIFNWKNPVEKATHPERFNWHPVLMVSAFVLFMGEAIISYRILPFDHATQKYIHLILQTLALSSSTVGLWMIITFHKSQTPPIANFYSIHAMLGLATYVLFCAQYLSGLFTFIISWWIPSIPKEVRSSSLPWHRYVGVVLFLMCWAAMLSGLMDRQRINPPKEFSPPMNMANAAGMLIMLSGAVILYHFSPVAKEKEQSEVSQRLLP